MENELFEKMPVPKAYLKLALPVMMSSVLMLVYNMVDMYFIAKTNNTALVAVCPFVRRCLPSWWRSVIYLVLEALP